MITAWPTVLGIEGAGVVDAVGSDVTRFKVGDKVLTICGGRGDVKRAAGFQVGSRPIHCEGPGTWQTEEYTPEYHSLSLCRNMRRFQSIMLQKCQAS